MKWENTGQLWAEEPLGKGEARGGFYVSTTLCCVGDGQIAQNSLSRRSSTEDQGIHLGEIPLSSRNMKPRSEEVCSGDSANQGQCY